MQPGFQGQIAISLRSVAQHPQGEPKARRIWALTLKTPASEFLCLIERAFAPQSSGAALSPRRATHFSLLRQRKVSKRKATLLSASLRFAAGNLRCSVQPGSRANSLRSNKHEPCSVWTSAPRRIQKGFAGTGSEADSGSSAFDACYYFNSSLRTFCVGCKPKTFIATTCSLVFRVRAQFRCKAKRSTRRASQRRGEFVLRPRKRPLPNLFLIERARTLHSPGAALSPRRATDFLLLRQKKVGKEKATLLSASLRCATGNLRCSVQPGSSSNSLRSNNRSPLSVWTSAPQRRQKGLGSPEFGEY